MAIALTWKTTCLGIYLEVWYLLLPKTKPPNQYRPTWECHELNLWLITWVEYEHSQDSCSVSHAPYNILSQAQCDLLVCTQISAITAPSITKILDKTLECEGEWAEKLYKVIRDYQTIHLLKPWKLWICYTVTLIHSCNLEIWNGNVIPFSLHQASCFEILIFFLNVVREALSNFCQPIFHRSVISFSIDTFLLVSLL